MRAKDHHPVSIDQHRQNLEDRIVDKKSDKHEP